MSLTLGTLSPPRPPRLDLNPSFPRPKKHCLAWSVSLPPGDLIISGNLRAPWILRAAYSFSIEAHVTLEYGKPHLSSASSSTLVSLVLVEIQRRSKANLETVAARTTKKQPCSISFTTVKADHTHIHARAGIVSWSGARAVNLPLPLVPDSFPQLIADCTSSARRPYFSP